MFATKRQVKVTLVVALAVLLLIVGIYTVYAEHKSGRTDDAQWYYGVNDVRALPGLLKTNSYHYYWFQALGSKNLWGRWEFSHRVREGWALRLQIGVSKSLLRVFGSRGLSH